MPTRNERAQIARETLDIIEKGYYLNSNGEKNNINRAVKEAIENSVLYTPDVFPKIEDKIKKIREEEKEQKKMEVVVNNETTLQAAERLVREEGYKNTVCLNFASGTNPGGGFLQGSGAQEESLARSSALYPTIAQMDEMYQKNRDYVSALYKEYMIYSPQVPVFRRDNGQLLNEPYKVSFITAPAVNAGVVRARESRENITKIAETMKKRIKEILSLALVEGENVLVLGAFGCGVFKNDPEKVASYFKKYLLDNYKFKDLFEKVVFAVLDRSKKKTTYKIFKDKLNIT